MKEGYVILGIILGVIGLLTVWFCGWILIIIGIILFVYGLVASDPQPPPIMQQAGYYQQQPGYYPQQPVYTQQPTAYYQQPPPPQPYGPPQYPCAYCGRPMTYIQQNGRWFCASCNRYN